MKTILLLSTLLLALPVHASYNNPGNLRQMEEWRGEVPCPGEFECFESPAMGIRAMVITLNTYYHVYNLRTVRSIISRWAPPHENDTESYIHSISTGLCVGASTDIPTFDPIFVGEMVLGIIRHETGSLPLSEAEIKLIVYYTMEEL